MTECQIFSLPARPNSVNKYVIDHAWGQDGNGWILAKLSICVFIHKNAEIPRSVKVSKVHILKTMNLKYLVHVALCFYFCPLPVFVAKCILEIPGLKFINILAFFAIFRDAFGFLVL